MVNVLVMTKICSQCSEEKPATTEHFYAHKFGKLGLQAKCIPCFRKSINDKYDPEKNREWKRKQVERDPHYRRRGHLRTIYGITLEEYDAMLEKQGGVCAICGGKPQGRRKNFDVDHCHTTGKVRGLLCTRCNRMIGWAGEDIELLRNAVTYLDGAV